MPPGSIKTRRFICQQFRHAGHAKSVSTQHSLPVLYQDDDLIAVHKPSGMFVHPSDADRSVSETAMQLLRDQIGAFIYPVHRLDRATSGVLLMALNPEAAAGAGRAFTERRVRKTYRALVRGFTDEEGRICDPLVPARGRKLPDDHPHAEPQEAETEYRTLARFEVPVSNDRHPTTRSSLVEAFPKTGRYHQIRRHFNYISHPVIGDTSHGDSRHNAIYREHFGMTRLMLAAVELVLPHPRRDVEVKISAPPERLFTSVVQQLQAHTV